MKRNFVGNIYRDFEVTSCLLIIKSAFFKYLRKWEHNGTMHHLFLGFKKAYDSINRKVCYPYGI